MWKFIASRASRILALTLPLFILALTFIFLSPKIGFVLFPASDEGIINISVEAKTWTDKSALEEYIPQIEQVLSSFEEMKVYYVSVSGNTISVSVELLDSNVRDDRNMLSVFEVEDH